MIVSAAGHRFVKLPGQEPRRFTLGDPNTVVAQGLIREHLSMNRPEGFIICAHLGFSLLAAEVAQELRIPTIVALPYAGYGGNWPEPFRDIYLRVMLGASRVHYMARSRRGDPIDRCDRWMIDQAGSAIVLWNGTGGRVNDLVQYAWSRRKNVVNLWRNFLIQRGIEP